MPSRLAACRRSPAHAPRAASIRWRSARSAVPQQSGSATTPSWAARRSNASEFAHRGRERGQALVDAAQRQVRCIPGRPRPEGLPRSRPRSQAPAASDHRPPLLGDAQVPHFIQHRGQPLRWVVEGVGQELSARAVAVPPLPPDACTQLDERRVDISRRPCESVITTASGVRSMKSAKRFPCRRIPSAVRVRTREHAVAGTERRCRNAPTQARRRFRYCAANARSSPGRPVARAVISSSSTAARPDGHQPHRRRLADHRVDTAVEQRRRGAVIP